MTQAKRTSYWLGSIPGPAFPALERPLAVDVAIVGGGITGLTAAWALKRAGRTVAVLERHRVAGAETGHTTAHLTMAMDTGLEDLVRGFGREGAQTVWQAGRAAIAHVEETLREAAIDADFRRVPGYLFARREADMDRVEREARLARELGFVADLVEDAPFPAMRHGAMRLAEQARVHPRKYLVPLAERLPGGGCHVFEHTEVTAWSGGEGDAPWRVIANGHAVEARHLIFATHQPIHDKFYAARVPAWQTYAAAWRVPHGAFGDALAWDTGDPYHYWRITPDGAHDLLIVGGEDHRTGQADAEAAFRGLMTYVEAWLGDRPHQLAWRWSGQWLEPVDGAPFIGRVPGQTRAYLATGFGGNGITLGTYGGLVMADLAMGRERPDAAIFDPGRLKLRAGAVTFISENLAYPAYLLMDRLGPTERRTLSDLAPGEGAVLGLGGEQVAASRDEDGTLHAVSAICTHMGCVVHWNGAEKSWDCPCHGSRFEPNGEVMNGPALHPLPPCRAARQAAGAEGAGAGG